MFAQKGSAGMRSRIRMCWLCCSAPQCSVRMMWSTFRGRERSTGKIFLCETALWEPSTVTHLEGERWGTATAGSLWEDKLLCSKTDHPPAVHCTFCLNCCRLWRMSSPWGLVSLHLPHEIEGLASTFPINYCYCKEGNRQGKDFLVILATFCLQKAHVVGEFQNASRSREGRCTVETFEGDE